MPRNLSAFYHGLILCSFILILMSFWFNFTDVQRRPHGAELHVEESDGHQRNDAVATKQTLLLGPQRQVSDQHGRLNNHSLLLLSQINFNMLK